MPARSFSAMPTSPPSSPTPRVKRGLVRTFQINALFPHLNALEAVTLAVCERRGVSGEWWKPLPAYGEAVEEAYAILGSLMLAADCYRLTRSWPTASSGCSRSRWRWRRGRRCCCSTSRQPACRARRAPSCSPPLPACRRTSPCSSSSTTWTSCSGSRAASSSWSAGRILRGGHAAGDRGRCARARGLSRRGRAMSARGLLAVEADARRLRRGRGARRRLASRFPSTAASRCSAATASASRRCCSASWATPR